MIWERHLEHWIVGQRVGWLDDFFIALSWIGSLGAVWVAIALAVAVAWRRPSVLLMVVAADAAGDLVSNVGKALIPRHRPFEHQLGPPSSTHSFPSGHAATSFACATVLAHYVPRLRVVFFVLAALIAFSRVYNGMHYPSDVLAGSILGVLTALLLLAAVRLRSRRAPRSG
ncbi:MAG: phosphatase PAP2 family protein [Gaiellaceae bacterium]